MNYIKVENNYFETYVNNKVSNKWRLRWKVKDFYNVVKVVNLEKVEGKQDMWKGSVSPVYSPMIVFKNGDVIKISIKDGVPIIEEGTKEMWGV